MAMRKAVENPIRKHSPHSSPRRQHRSHGEGGQSAFNIFQEGRGDVEKSNRSIENSKFEVTG